MKAWGGGSGEEGLGIRSEDVERDDHRRRTKRKDLMRVAQIMRSGLLCLHIIIIIVTKHYYCSRRDNVYALIRNKKKKIKKILIEFLRCHRSIRAHIYV